MLAPGYLTKTIQDASQKDTKKGGHGEEKDGGISHLGPLRKMEDEGPRETKHATDTPCAGGAGRICTNMTSTSKIHV